VDNKSNLLNELRIDRSQQDFDAPNPWPKVIGAVVAAIVIAGAAWWWFRPKPMEVETGRTRSEAAGAVSSVLDGTGYVTARRMATVSSKITGKVREVFIEEGQRVAADEVLAYLDDVEAKAQVGLAEAQRQSAIQAQNELRVNLAQAERELKRQQDLMGRKLTSQQALDNAVTAVDALNARLATQAAQVRVSAQSLVLAQEQLANTIVRAPFAGVVTVKAAQPGEMISPISAGGGFTRTGIGTIVDMDSLEVQVDVAEAFINRVSPGQKVEAVLNAYPDWRIPASVIAIIPTADRARATVRVRIAFEVKDERIVPEMGVRVAFLDTKPTATASLPRAKVYAPEAAVVDRDGATVVFLMEDDRAVRRAVKAGLAHNEEVQIEAGLSGGETLILNPVPEIVDGIEVRLKSEDE